MATGLETRQLAAVLKTLGTRIGMDSGMEATSSKTGLMYDVRMEEHKMELVSWHPEQPDRIRLPWEALKKSGYVKRCHIMQVSIIWRCMMHKTSNSLLHHVLVASANSYHS